MSKSVKAARIITNVLNFQIKVHRAWDFSESFSNRIRDLPLYFLVFNHPNRDKSKYSVTVTHYVPCKAEMMALADIIRSCTKTPKVCDIGCGNGFIGSLLAREGVNVFGIDNRSYDQPEISSFCDDECYSIVETELKDPKITFDVGFCCWMESNNNLTPQIVAKNPLLIIHILSPDRQSDGSPTTGSKKAYACPAGYRFLIGWRSLFPRDYFLSLNELIGSVLSAKPQNETSQVCVYVHEDLASIKAPTLLDFSGVYDWDKERDFINELRHQKGLAQWRYKVSIGGCEY